MSTKQIPITRIIPLTSMPVPRRKGKFSKLREKLTTLKPGTCAVLPPTSKTEANSLLSSLSFKRTGMRVHVRRTEKATYVWRD